MKKYIKILFILFLGLGLYSCEDSLGYDPNVTISEIISDTTAVNPEDSVKSTVFSVDSINATFTEYVKIRNEFIKYNWPGNTIRKNIKVDTSGSKTILWLDWVVETSLEDDDYRGSGRIDRVNKFEMIFDAKLDSRNYDMNISRDMRRWLSFEFRRMGHNSMVSVQPDDFRSQVFVLEDDRDAGILRIMFVAEFRSNMPIQVKRFDGRFDIFYKN